MDNFSRRIYLVGPGGYELKLSSGSVQHDLADSSAGHLMLPCHCFNVPMKHREEFTSFVVGDYFDSTVVSSAPKRSSGGLLPASNASSCSRGTGSQGFDRMAEFNCLVNRAHDELDVLVASAPSNRQG